ncbi:MAG: ABC transporter permease subunit [Acidobacteriota bacterium]
MHRIVIIAQNTFRETVRDKVLYNLLVFVFLLIAASLLIAELSLNQEQLIIARMGLTVMLFFGVLIAIFIGTGLVYKEIDKRTIYAMLAKPVRRSEFILGKFFGLTTTLLVNCSVMMVAILSALAYLNYTRYGLAMIPWVVLSAGYMIFLELLVIVAFALSFSSFTTPALSVMFSVILYLIGSLSQDLLLFANTVPSAILKYIALALYYILPNLSNFNYITKVSHGETVPAMNILAATAYAALYITLLLVATMMIFQKRNFK